MASKKRKHIADYGGSLFVGCIIIGLGIGLLLGNAAAGVLIGLGVGFIVMGLSKMITGFVSRPIDREENSEK